MEIFGCFWVFFWEGFGFEAGALAFVCVWVLGFGVAFEALCGDDEGEI